MLLYTDTLIEGFPIVEMTDLLDPFFDDTAQVEDDWKVGENFGEDRQGVPDLDVVFGLQAHHKSLGNLVVPLVTDVPVVLKVHSV